MNLIAILWAVETCVIIIHAYNQYLSSLSEVHVTFCFHEFLDEPFYLHNLYSVGGYDGTSFLSSMECYDPSSNQWSLLAPMAIRRSEFHVYHWWMSTARKFYTNVYVCMCTVTMFLNCRSAGES